MEGNTQSMPLEVRLQNLIKGWQGVQRGEGLRTLHNQCVEIAGRENTLLPANLYLTQALNTASLEHTLKRTSAIIRFQTPIQGRFDSALVPIGKGDGPLDRFLLVIDATLPGRDQVALYAHAFGHLLLNYRNRDLDHGRNLDPDNKMTHVDRLAELRYVELLSNRNLADREVLEAFPLLAELAEAPVESKAAVIAATSDLQKRLETLGWTRGGRLVSPYEYTAGRVLTEQARRGRKQTIDILLRASISLPIAVVHAQRDGQTVEDGMLRARNAAMRLNVPFAYLARTDGVVQECEYRQGEAPLLIERPDLPTHTELVERWLTTLGLTSLDERRTLFHPYQQQARSPRYYQDAAINQALIALLQARRGLHRRRILLTLATGTGKTHVAFQLIWKLKQTQAVGNVLFLADRSYLVGQAIDKEFAPFNDAIFRGRGEITTSRDLYFATYQWLTTFQDGRYKYEDYPPEFFDVVIVDECHRGSASENSQWRRVLEYFSPAIQIGLTATPLKNRDVQTRDYFGPAVYTYSLSRGINDGFLAPYRVRRVLIGPQAQSSESDAASADPLQSSSASLRDDAASTELAADMVMETARTMREYTQAIAVHLARYLQATDPRAKTIVFCVDNEHAQDMRDALRKACAGWIRPNGIVRIVDDEGANGRQALYDFCSTSVSQPVVVTTSKLLSTGIDAPMCKNIVLARAIGSMVEFKQIIGRGTRLFGTEKTWFTILDYAGAIKHFFDPAFDGNPEFIVSEELNSQPAGETPPSAARAEDENEEQAHAGEQGSVNASEPVAAQPEDDVAEMETPEEQTQEEPQAAVELATSNPAYGCEIPSPSSSASVLSSADEDEADEMIYPFERSSDLHPEARLVVDEQQNELVADPTSSDEPAVSRPIPASASDEERADSTPEPLPLAELLEKGGVLKESDDGKRFVVLGEKVYELGPDSKTLRNWTGEQWAKQALQDVVRTPEELRACWLDPLQRAELFVTLDEQGMALEKLANMLQLPEADPFDILRQALFALPPLDREVRAARLRWENQAFFERFAANPLATSVLNAILDWYVTIPMATLSRVGELDVSNRDLLGLPTIAGLGMPLEIAKAFSACGMHIQTALEELHRLLYSV